MIAFVEHKPFAAFKYNQTGDQDPAYLKMKEKIKSMFLKKPERIIPGIQKHIVVCEIATPTTIKHDIGATNGNVYGTEKSYRQIGPMSFRAKSEIEELYLVGASTSSHGVAGAAMSGVQGAAKLIGCSWKSILRVHSQDLKVLPAESPHN